MPKELVAAGAPLDADVEMARQGGMEALKALLLAQVAAGRGTEAIDQVLGSMMALKRENERLAWRVLRAKPAPGEPEQTEPTDATDMPTGERDYSDDVEAPEPEGKKRRQVQQMRVDPTVERNVQAVALPEQERSCSLCALAAPSH